MSDLEEIENSGESETIVQEKEQERVCFICGLPGDPIDNRIKCLSSAILKKCIEAIDVRNKQQPSTSRRSMDTSSIQLPKDLEEKGYHQKCYKQLTNLSGKRKIEEIVDPDANENSESEEPEEHISFEHGPSACVFCTQVRKRHHRQLMSCSFAKVEKNYETFHVVIDIAIQKYDIALLQRIDQCQKMSVPIPYHRVCKTEYLNKSRQKKENTDWHLRKQKHERARENLFIFIQEEIVENMRIFKYSFLLNLFRQFLLEEYDNEKLPKCFDTSNLQSEILEYFKDSVIIIHNRGCKHVVSASATLENIDMTYVNEESTINSSALFLHKIILRVEKNLINENVTAPKLSNLFILSKPRK